MLYVITRADYENLTGYSYHEIPQGSVTVASRDSLTAASGIFSKCSVAVSSFLKLFCKELVIVGTYELFMSVSIALLKMLKKNKKYYYQTAGSKFFFKIVLQGILHACIKTNRC